MTIHGGQIVAISSISSICPSPYCPEYSGTSAAVNAFMKALGDKLRLKNLHKKIKLTTFCPFFILTQKEVKNFLDVE
jgi:short-subunit dehydrogenase